MRPILHLSLPVRDLRTARDFYVEALGCQAARTRDDFNELLVRLEAAAVPWVAPVTTDNEGLPTEQTKAKLADPSGNVIEIKSYRDVDAALEISPHSYPEAVTRGN